MPENKADMSRISNKQQRKSLVDRSEITFLNYQ